MIVQASLPIAIWAVLTLLSGWRWAPERLLPPRPKWFDIASLLVLVGGTAVVATLASLCRPVPQALVWLVAGLALLASVITGGSATRSLLDLADTSRSAGSRVQKTVLRGGAWIGALERLTLTATVLAGWPEGIGVIIAVKGLARYPELRTAQGTGAAERFIIGTFASLGWAAACAAIGLLLT